MSLMELAVSFAHNLFTILFKFISTTANVFLFCGALSLSLSIVLLKKCKLISHTCTHFYSADFLNNNNNSKQWRYSPNQPMDGVKLGFSYDLSKIKIKN